MGKRYVGILVNGSWYRRIPSGQPFHESLPCYEEAGRLHGVVPCFFRLKDIKPGQTVIWAYVKNGSGAYKKCRIPAPDVIHNRTLYTSERPKRAIRRLVQDGKRIFNEWNRYGKWLIHELLLQDATIRPHLPDTREATAASLKEMMGSYDKLILKPDSSSIGMGIMKLERTGNGWLLNYAARGQGRTRKTVFFRKLMPAVVRQKMRMRRYLVQQLLPLAKYRGQPFDLRVSVQRDATGDWQVTGIAAKVAKKDAFLTNVAQGGSVHTLEKVLEEHPCLSVDVVRRDIECFSLRVARHLSLHLPHLADIGLDVGITEYGFPMFIECNGRDLRYSFLKGGMPETFQKSYSNPIGYAKYLLESAE